MALLSVAATCLGIAVACIIRGYPWKREEKPDGNDQG
jgi:hypothetical protein